MEENALLPHLFRTEYRKLVAVLSKTFGIAHIEIAEDIVSDTFLSASELWGLKGIPENPTAWLYTVAKNKTRNMLKRDGLFAQKIASELRLTPSVAEFQEIDLSPKSIQDSQLAMIFTVCHPSISAESQIALALNLLCGFGIPEIADAFLTNKEVIYKRLNRAKEQLKTANIQIEQPGKKEISNRMDTVLITLYLLFNEGYYSASQNTVLRKDFCIEAIRLALLLAGNKATDTPAVNALLSLMCFHASRFEARTDDTGEMVLYDDQDTALWDQELIEKGNHYLNRASQGNVISKYHLEAAIAYWHTQKNAGEKWEIILQLYNRLLQIEYSPMAALNRTYALAKANGNAVGIIEAEKLQLAGNRLYHFLLGYLHANTNNIKARYHYETALGMAKTESDKAVIRKKLASLES
jgi:RNA polymerase sigma factor (sigma-70 family)